jgi:hypothetical protein
MTFNILDCKVENFKAYITRGIVEAKKAKQRGQQVADRNSKIIEINAQIVEISRK